MWNPDGFLQNMMAQCKPELSFKASSMEEMQDWQRRLRKRFVKLLGGFPGENAGLEPVMLESADCGEYTRHRVEIGTYAGLRMPCYLLVPNSAADAPRPAVIALHGHGTGGSKGPVGLQPDGSDNADNPDYHNNFALMLVRAGYVTLVPELLGFGDRKLAADADQDNSCHRISTLLLAMGLT
ncbi:MAG: dienelactone hydrolase, partial [Cohnella sp.]|nr:dienelactone hydrolase [Cohnella sp.]